jgi:4-cresol dehydrogenase (hydroxylating) flavoprotein subunit
MSFPHTELIGVFRRALPSESLVVDREVIERKYQRNVTGLARSIPLVLRPGTEEEVQNIVALANEHQLPLYPFSTGKNWGLGSKLPVVDGCVLVDLSRMNRILAVNEEFGYAIIEPGVTQASLAGYLHTYHPGLTINFTGSFAHTSIVGNVLERGDGRYARVHDLLGVRGILGTGEPFQVGGWWPHIDSPMPSHHAKLFAGPDLTGLFTQSSFGIVTQLAFRLIHKPECCSVFWGIAQEERLEAVIESLDYFGKQGVINRESVNIGYANRFVQAKNSLVGDNSRGDDQPDVWNFYVIASGTTRVMEALMEELKEVFDPLCISSGTWCVEQSGDPYTKLPPFLHPLIKPLLGIPDNTSIELIYHLTSTPLPLNPLELDADLTPFGMKCYIPVIPPQGKYVRQAVDIVSNIRKQFNLNVKLSIFGDGRALITIHFRSDSAEQVRCAEMCELSLWNAMTSAGFPPYRVGIDQMQRLIELQPAFFDIVAQLKTTFDPNNIISPGRYCPLQRSSIE